jgi:hypothetical protein
MTPGSGFCASFKKELLRGMHHLDMDQIFMALYTAAAPLDMNLTTSYLIEGEVAAPGYTAGGKQLLTPQVLGPLASTAYMTWDDAIWPGATIQARAALIYNNSYQQAAIAVLDFGSDQYSNQGNFIVKFPPPGVATALVRLL